MPPFASRIGAMRESLVLQRNTITTSTGDGFQTDGWTTFARVPGEYMAPANGRESWQGSAVTAELRPTFRIRDRSDVEPRQRVKWGSVTLQIEAVIPLHAVGARFLLLECGRTQ